MKNKFLIIVFLSIYILPSIPLKGQNSYERQIKYWYLRDRLRHFIVPSDDPLNNDGTCLVITSRNRNWKANSGFTEIADYGQQHSMFGKYIGVLATEYRLLIDGGRYIEAMKTNDELLLAIDAYKRLDLCEDDLDPWAPLDYDGFFIRHDAPEDDNGGSTNSFLLQSDLNTNGGLLIDDDQLLVNGNIIEVIQIESDPPMTPFDEFMSQDEAIFLLEGLALAYKFGSSEVQAKASEYAHKVLNRMWGYTSSAHWCDWQIYDAYNEEIPSEEGGDCFFYSYGLTKVAEFFGFDDFEFTATAREFWRGFYTWTPGPDYNGHMTASIAAIGDGWDGWYMPGPTEQGIVNNTIGHGWHYYYVWLYKALWDNNTSIIPVEFLAFILDTAPCEGPWCKSSQEFAPGGWAGPDRWRTYIDEQMGENIGDIGIYSGLDYMILLNLYYLCNGDDLIPYKNYISAVLDQVWPQGNVGSIVNPTSLSYFREITSTEIMQSNPLEADVTYHAMDNIRLKPGFKVENGALFLAQLQPLDYCSDKSAIIKAPVSMDVKSYNRSGYHNSATQSKHLGERNSLVRPSEKNEEFFELQPEANIVVYPNPSTGMINVINALKYSNYEVRTIFGEKVLKGNIITNTFTLNFSGLAKGMYLLIFTSQEYHYVCKITLI